MDERSHLTVAEVAAALGLPARTVYYRLEHGYMTGERVSPKLWLVPRTELERWKGRGKLPRGRYSMRPGDTNPA
jgi:excisionase family DNA binding protein